MRKSRFAAVLVTAPLVAGMGLLAGTGPASAAPAATAAATIHHAGSCTAQGDFATCVASGNSTFPVRIRVHVHARPNQHVLVAWDVICSKGTGSGSKHGQFHAVTPVNHLIRHNYAHPDSCVVSADSQLEDGGNFIHVNITYTR